MPIVLYHATQSHPRHPGLVLIKPPGPIPSTWSLQGVSSRSHLARCHRAISWKRHPHSLEERAVPRLRAYFVQSRRCYCGLVCVLLLYALVGIVAWVISWGTRYGRSRPINIKLNLVLLSSLLLKLSSLVLLAPFPLFCATLGSYP